MASAPLTDAQLDSPDDSSDSSSVVSTGEAILRAVAHEDRTLRTLLGLNPKAKKSKMPLGAMLGLLAAGPVLYAAKDFLSDLTGLSSLFDTLRAVSEAVDPEAALAGRDALMKLFDSPELEQVEVVPTQASMSTSNPYAVHSSAMARPSEHIDNVLRKVSAKTKVDYATLYALAGTESNFKSDARAGTSSATGMMQFTEGTWKYLTKEVFPELGYTLADRLDPEKSATLAALYVTQINNRLQSALGRKPSVGDLYLGYFLGPSGAVKFLKALQANPEAPSASLFPKAASANVNLFYKRDGSAMTLAETYLKITGRISSYYARANTPASVQVAAAPTGKSTPSSSQVTPATETVGKNQTVTVQLPPVSVASADQSAPMSLNNKPLPSYTYTRDKHDRLVVIPT